MRLAAAALLLAAASSAFAQDFQIERIMRPAADGSAVQTEVAAGQVWVKFANGVDHAVAVSAVGGTVAKEFPFIGWTLVNLPAGVTVASGIDLFSAQLGVSQVDGNHVYRHSRSVSDPGVPSQYGLTRVNAFNAWDIETGDGPGNVVIAVVDGGVDTSIADLDGKVAATNHVNFTGAGALQNPDPLLPDVACSHGTNVASVAAAEGDNATGIAGVAWGNNVKVVSLRVFPDGCPSITETPIVAAVNYAVGTLAGAGLGRIVLNLSLGGPGSCASTTRDALNAAVAANIPVVIATGNDGGAVQSPANCATATRGTGIIPAGGTDQNDSVWTGSSRGPELAANGVVAPALNVLTNDPAVANGGTGGMVTVTGTSFAAPHVAGLAALLLSNNAALTAYQVQSLITSPATNIGISLAGNSSGMGRMDAYRSMRLSTTGSAGSADLTEKAVAYPNPFRPSQHSSVTITIPRGEEGASRTIKIFTMAGQLVRKLGGLTWDGRNEGGTLVASGTYLFSISLGDKVFNGRLAVIR